MRSHSFAIVTILLCLVSSTGIATGQVQPTDQDASGDPHTIPSGPTPPSSEILRRLERLEEVVRSLRDDTLPELTGRVAGNESGLQRIAQSVTTNGEAIRSLFDRLDENDTAISDLQQRVQDNNRKLLDVAKQDSQGGWYPNLLGNVQKPEFRQELRAVVTQSGATQGRLWINNPNPYDHVIYINGARWRALAGLSYVWVPFGNVSVSHIGGRTPPVRRAADWTFNEQDRVYDLTYDFGLPW